MTGFASSNEAIEQKLPCFYCCYKYVEVVATENNSDCQKPLAAYFHGY
jgi:hypothetical protein